MPTKTASKPKSNEKKKVSSKTKNNSLKSSAELQMKASGYLLASANAKKSGR